MTLANGGGGSNGHAGNGFLLGNGSLLANGHGVPASLLGSGGHHHGLGSNGSVALQAPASSIASVPSIGSKLTSVSLAPLLPLAPLAPTSAPATTASAATVLLASDSSVLRTAFTAGASPKPDPASLAAKSRKKCKSKVQPKTRTIKFHEYKVSRALLHRWADRRESQGPPSAQKGAGAASPASSASETSYELLLKQQQLFLQWQLEWQQKYPHIVMPPNAQVSCSTCMTCCVQD